MVRSYSGTEEGQGSVYVNCTLSSNGLWILVFLAAKEDKEGQSCFDDVLRLEHQERAKLPSV